MKLVMQTERLANLKTSASGSEYYRQGGSASAAELFAMHCTHHLGRNGTMFNGQSRLYFRWSVKDLDS